MVYSDLKKDFVIQTIAKGSKVILCDFKSKKMTDCNDMTVGVINSAIARSDTKFFTENADE